MFCLSCYFCLCELASTRKCKKVKEWDISVWASGLANTVWLAGRITDSPLSWRWVYFPVTATSQQLCWKNRKWKINTDQGRPGIVRLKGRWLLYSLIEWRIEWSVLLWRLSISCVSTATPSGQFLWSFIERPPSLGGKSLKYRSRVTIITRSNYSYHFLLSFQLSMPILVGGPGLNPGRSQNRVHYQKKMPLYCLFKTLPQTRRSGSGVNRKRQS